MMADFFDIRKDSGALFEGLSVSKNQELCKTWMNQYPTVFVSFRNVDGLDFQQAYAKLYSTIEDLYNEHLYLMKSTELNPNDLRFIQNITEETARCRNRDKNHRRRKQTGCRRIATGIIICPFGVIFSALQVLLV